MPTICVIGRRYPIEEKDISDGGTLNIYVVVHELLRSGYNIEVFTRNEGNGKEVVELPGLRVYRVPFARFTNRNVLIRDYEEGKSFVGGVVAHDGFRPNAYTCIHTHHWTNGVGLESRIQANVRLIHTPHLLASEKAHYNNISFPSDVKRAEQTLLNRANHIIASSESEKVAMCTTYHTQPSKITVAPNGIDDAFFEIPPLGLSAHSTPSVLSVGRICRQKGIDVLLDAAEQIIKSGTLFSLRLVGGNYAEPAIEKIVEERTQKAPLLGAVERLGKITHESVLSLLQDSFIYVQPSRYESQGIALLEAMAAGRAVIASDLPAIREYIKHGENGLLVEPENPQVLTDALHTLLTNPEQSLALGRVARKTAQAYTWQRMMRTIIPLYQPVTE